MSDLPPLLRSRCVRYHEYGDPLKVLHLEVENVETTLKPNEILVRWLASPVLPADVNIVMNTYMRKRPPPANFGSEGVGVVKKVGSAVQNLQVGDHVVNFGGAQGMWTEFQKLDAEQTFRIDSRVPLLMAANFAVNPPTAWMMLKMYVDLVAGDYVIQNSANSGVGRAVIELARAWGIKTINLVRDRDDLADMKADLHSIGADYVFSESKFKSNGRKFVESLDRSILLALNGVGGRSSLMLSSSLGYGGTMVTYGGMGREPHQMTTSALVFRGVQMRGIWMGDTLSQAANRHIRDKIYRELEQLCIEGKLNAPKVETHPIERFDVAIRNAVGGQKRPKQMILLGDEPTKNSKL